MITGHNIHIVSPDRWIVDVQFSDGHAPSEVEAFEHIECHFGPDVFFKDEQTKIIANAEFNLMHFKNLLVRRSK